MDSLNEIVDRQSKRVYRLAYAIVKNKHDADDIYQNVFLRYMKSKRTFSSLEHEKAWFIRTTINVSKTTLYDFWHKRVVEFQDNIVMPETNQEDLSEALHMLSKKERALIHLYYYEDLSTKEMAHILHIREGTLRMQLTRARRHLKEILEHERDI